MANRAYLDSNAIIRFLESNDDDVLFAFEQAAEGFLTLLTSAFALAEVLVKPLQENDQQLAEAYREFITSDDVLTVREVDRQVLLLTAEIRATVGNKTPDAIHIATAVIENCNVFVSSDKRLKLPDRLTRVAIQEITDWL